MQSLKGMRIVKKIIDYYHLHTHTCTDGNTMNALSITDSRKITIRGQEERVIRSIQLDVINRIHPVPCGVTWVGKIQ